MAHGFNKHTGTSILTAESSGLTRVQLCILKETDLRTITHTVREVSEALLTFIGAPGPTKYSILQSNGLYSSFHAWPDSVLQQYEIKVHSFNVRPLLHTAIGGYAYSQLAFLSSTKLLRVMNSQSFGVFTDLPEINYTWPAHDQILVNCLSFSDSVYAAAITPNFARSSTAYSDMKVTNPSNLGAELIQYVFSYDLSYRSVGNATSSVDLSYRDVLLSAKDNARSPVYVLPLSLECEKVSQVEPQFTFESLKHIENTLETYDISEALSNAQIEYVMV